ncbi:MAG TPA: class I SAM-dependent methyltransferase [Balneolaceae bacterium]|nr:class I SAM-dependent methyltransferase [Balneolaceae bacterium]
MPFFLSERNTTSVERMDDPQCNLADLENTYRQFGTLNSLISGWRTIYRNEIRPSLSHSHQCSLLDVGFGGGDIPKKIAQWATEDDYNLRITAIDPDPRAFNFVRKQGRHPNIEFLQCNISELDPAENKFDFVISNHLLHHLSPQQLSQILNASRKLSTQSVIFNDICRSDWAWLFFNLLSRPVFRSSFITYDGLTSIKRSYTPQELKKSVPADWIVESFFPFRLLLKYHHG